MGTNREKFSKLVTSINTDITEEIKHRNANRDWLHRSKRIATKVLMALKEQSLSQKGLADRMGVSAQYINKLVKGNENFTLETCTKLENILGIKIYDDSIKGKKSVDYTDFYSSYENKYEVAEPIYDKTAI